MSYRPGPIAPDPEKDDARELGSEAGTEVEAKADSGDCAEATAQRKRPNNLHAACTCKQHGAPCPTCSAWRDLYRRYQATHLMLDLMRRLRAGGVRRRWRDE